MAGRRQLLSRRSRQDAALVLRASPTSLSTCDVARCKRRQLLTVSLLCDSGTCVRCAHDLFKSLMLQAKWLVLQGGSKFLR